MFLVKFQIKYFFCPHSVALGGVHTASDRDQFKEHILRGGAGNYARPFGAECQNKWGEANILSPL